MSDVKKDHRLEEVLAYKQGFLEGDELAAFEAHLRECKECQATLEEASRFLPALNQAMMMEEAESDAEVLASVRAQAKTRIKARSPKRFGGSMALKARLAWTAFAVAAGGTAYLVAQPLIENAASVSREVDAGERGMAAPPPPAPAVRDAGVDAGEADGGAND